MQRKKLSRFIVKFERILAIQFAMKPALAFIFSIFFLSVQQCLPVYSILMTGSDSAAILPLIPGGSNSGSEDTSVPASNTTDPVITDATDFDYLVLVNDTAAKNPVSGIMSIRALGISPDRNTLYTCMVLGSAGNKLLRSYSSSSGALVNGAIYPDVPKYCKATAVHSSGRVYYALADSDQIGVYNSDLGNQVLYNVDTAVGLLDSGNKDFDPEGLTVHQNYLYISSDKLGRIYRFNLDSGNGDILSYDAAWAGGFIQLQDGGNIGDSDNLVQIKVNANDNSIWAAVENKNQVYRISSDGATVTTPIVLPAGAFPHDIDFFFNYLLVAYSSDDGDKDNPHGIGVFDLGSFVNVTTLADTGSQLRNAQGMVVDQANRLIYVVDGFYGAPDDFSQISSYDENAADIIMKLSFNK